MDAPLLLLLFFAQLWSVVTSHVLPLPLLLSRSFKAVVAILANLTNSTSFIPVPLLVPLPVLLLVDLLLLLPLLSLFLTSLLVPLSRLLLTNSLLLVWLPSKLPNVPTPPSLELSHELILLPVAMLFPVVQSLSTLAAVHVLLPLRLLPRPLKYKQRMFLLH